MTGVAVIIVQITFHVMHMWKEHKEHENRHGSNPPPSA
jgi:hypothetical protein